MEALIGKFLIGVMIFIRVTALLFSAPLFSSNNIPATVRLLIALTVTYIIFFTIPAQNIDYNSGYGELMLIGFKEALSGFILGFSLNFVFFGISFAAMLMGMDMGLNMATMLDPTTEIENNVLGQLFGLAAMVLFLSINGHHYIIRGLAVSFKIIPIGHFSMNESVFLLLVKGSAGIFIAAVKIVAPLMVAFFLLNIATGIISRIIPQMQVFFVIQPVQLMLGFAMLTAGMPLFLYIIKYLLEQVENNLYNLITAMGY